MTAMKYVHAGTGPFAFRFEFGNDGAMLSDGVEQVIRDVGEIELAVQRWYVQCKVEGLPYTIPSDMAVVVLASSANARHLLGRNPPRKPLGRLSGPGWISGVLVRDEA